jgi:leader peptidase (prepilin peptidase)/N-methyltransferase
MCIKYCQLLLRPGSQLRGFLLVSLTHPTRASGVCYTGVMIIVVATLVGALLGSMLSVLIARWPQLEGFWIGRSRCPQCLHVLAWYDLIPLVSWISLRSVCRYCKASVSWRYPVYELSMATVFGLYAYYQGIPSPWFLLEFVIVFGLVSLFFFDLYRKVLPDVIVAPLGALVLVRMIAYRPDLLVNTVSMALGLVAFFGLLFVVSKGRWLGLGDVKFAPVVGLLFGYPGAIGVTLLSIWLGALVGVGLILAKRAHMGSEVPFGAFWTAVCIVTLIVPGPAFFVGGLLTPMLYGQ